MENNLITKTNELFGEVRFVKIDEKEYAVGNDIAKSLGYKSPKDAIYKHCKGGVDLAIPSKGGIQSMKVIPEGDIYRLIMKSKLPQAEQFESWVMDEILPELRKNGVVILENATDKAIRNADIFRLRKVKSTFANSSTRDIEGLFEDFIEFASDKKADDRVKLYDSCIRGMEDFKTSCNDFVYSMLAENKIRILTEKRSKVKNNINGGLKGSQTKAISKLKNENEKLKTEANYYNPKLENYIKIPMSGFSSNYMYESCVVDGKLSSKKTCSYKKWIDNFPNEYIINNFSNVDLSQPTMMWLKFDCVSKIDTDNLIKSIQDQVVRALGFTDDNMIELGSVTINKRVKSYSEGNIYIIIKNSEELI